MAEVLGDLRPGAAGRARSGPTGRRASAVDRVRLVQRDASRSTDLARLGLVTADIDAMSWVSGADGSPYGVDRPAVRRGPARDGAARIGVRIGDHVLDLAAARRPGWWLAGGAFGAADAQRVHGAGPAAVDGGAAAPQRTAHASRRTGAAWSRCCVPLAQVRMDAAVRGRRLRRLLLLGAPRHQRRPDLPPRPGAAAAELEAPADRLPRPGRHGGRLRHPTSSGRAGQRGPARAARSFGPSVRLDIEAEVGFVVGVGVRLGEPVAVDAFADHVFGVVLVNDWSARDIQAWEYQPLGPFLGKSFATSVSAWVTPLDGAAAAWVPAPAAGPAGAGLPAPTPAPCGLDLRLSVEWNGERVSRPPFASHVLDAGAAARPPDRQRRVAAYRRPLRLRHGLRPGARTRSARFLELTWGGAEPVDRSARRRGPSSTTATP